MVYFFAGLVLGEVFARVNPYAAVVICFATAAGIYLIIKKNGQSRLWLALPIFFYCGIFIFRTGGCESEFGRQWNENGAEEEYVEACGEIEEIDELEDSLRLTLKNVSVSMDGCRYESRKLFVYTDKKDFNYGNTVTVKGYIKELDAASNPGQFDYRKYYRALNIEYFMDAGYCGVSGGKIHLLKTWLNRLKSGLLLRLESIVEEEDSGALSAMLLGDRSKLDEDLYSLYRLSGIAHILTISGLHISMIGTCVYKALKRLGAGFICSSVAAALLVCMYGLMTGPGTSSLRAIIMFMVMLAADCLGKSYDMASAVSFAGMLILAEYPLMLYQFAFQMSVGCILGIGITVPMVGRFLRLKKQAGKTAVTGAVIQFSTMPVLIYHTYTCPVLSAVINILVVPLAGMVMLSGYLGILFSYVNLAVARFLTGTAHFILALYKWLCGLVTGFEGALFMPGQPALWKTGLYYLVYMIYAVYMAYKIKEDKKQDGLAGPFEQAVRYLSVAAVCAVCVFILSWKNNDMLTVTFLDVGQGDSICIETASGKTLLIDGGSSNISDAGEKIIIPMLNFYGIDRLDYVLLSHCDADHINGIYGLIENRRVKTVILPDMPEFNAGFAGLTQLAKEYGVSVLYISAGQKITVSEVLLTCLNPSMTDSVIDENSGSMVLMLEYGDFGVMFTGDLDMEGEARVIQRAESFGMDLKCAVLKVGHHGSKYSSGEDFLGKVSPELSVISCSAANNYGHPSEEALERLKAAGSEVLITKDSGAVIVKTDGEKYYVTEYN